MKFQRQLIWILFWKIIKKPFHSDNLKEDEIKLTNIVDIFQHQQHSKTDLKINTSLPKIRLTEPAATTVAFNPNPTLNTFQDFNK